MIDLLLPASIAIGLVTWSLAAKWYLLPWMRTQSLADALTPLLLLNALRYVGLAFLIPGVTAEALDARFAVPAAWGDLAAAMLALLALLALRRRWSSAVVLVWVFNVFGALDLLNAVLGRSVPNKSTTIVSPDEELPEIHPAHGKKMENGAPTAYICRGNVCSAPVTSALTLSQILQMPAGEQGAVQAATAPRRF